MDVAGAKQHSFTVPELIEAEQRMEGVKASYTEFLHDPIQKAYIVPRKGWGPTELNFSLIDLASSNPLSIINPTFIVKDWDTSGVELKVDGNVIKPGKDFRIGYEETPTGNDLILWLRVSSTKPVQFTLTLVSN